MTLFDFSSSLGICHSIEVPFRYDHPHILSGQGTLGLEIVEEVPDLDAVVIPVGGGGLLAGVAVAVKALRPDVQIIVTKNYTYKLNYIFYRKVPKITTPPPPPPKVATLPPTSKAISILVKMEMTDIRLSFFRLWAPICLYLHRKFKI